MEIKHLEVLVMDNGEILCGGKTLGWVDSMGQFLKPDTKPILKSIEALADYIGDDQDEQRSYEEAEGQAKLAHITNDAFIVKNWIQEQK